MLQEAEAASEAPAEDDSFDEDDAWGSDDGDDSWGDDDDDWKRKKRSLEESPAKRWTRETHEVKIMEYINAAGVDRGGGEVSFKDLPILRNQLSTYPVLTCVPWTMMQTRMKRSSSYKVLIYLFHNCFLYQWSQ